MTMLNRSERILNRANGPSIFTGAGLGHDKLETSMVPSNVDLNALDLTG